MDTEADKHRQAARENVREAIKHLSCIVVDQCPGTDDFKDTFVYKLRGALNKLMDVREDIN